MCEPAPVPLIARIDLVAMRERSPLRCQPPRNSRTSRPSDQATICLAWYVMASSSANPRLRQAGHVDGENERFHGMDYAERRSRFKRYPSKPRDDDVPRGLPRRLTREALRPHRAAIPIVGWEGRAQPSKSPVIAGCHHPFPVACMRTPPRPTWRQMRTGLQTPRKPRPAPVSRFVPAPTWRAGPAGGALRRRRVGLSCYRPDAYWTASSSKCRATPSAWCAASATPGAR